MNERMLRVREEDDSGFDLFRGIIETLRALVPASGVLLLRVKGGRASQGLCVVAHDYVTLRPDGRVLDSLFKRAAQPFEDCRSQTCMGSESCRDMVAGLGPAAFSLLATDCSRLLVVSFHRQARPLGIAALARGPLEPPFFREDSALVEKLVPLMVSILWRENKQAPEVRPTDNGTLSGRESEISRLLVMGYSGVNVAAITGLRENTVKTYIRRIYQKLGISNRADLVRVLYSEAQHSTNRSAPQTVQEAWELGEQGMAKRKRNGLEVSTESKSVR